MMLLKLSKHFLRVMAGSVELVLLLIYTPRYSIFQLRGLSSHSILGRTEMVDYFQSRLFGFLIKQQHTVVHCTN